MARHRPCGAHPGGVVGDGGQNQRHVSCAPTGARRPRPACRPPARRPHPTRHPDAVVSRFILAHSNASAAMTPACSCQARAHRHAAWPKRGQPAQAEDQHLQPDRRQPAHAASLGSRRLAARYASVATTMPDTLPMQSSAAHGGPAVVAGPVDRPRRQPEHQPRGDHHAAAQPQHEVQPAQRPVTELDEMQAGQHALHAHHRCGLEALEQLPGGGVEVELVEIHRDLTGIGAAQLHVALGIARPPDPHEVRHPTAPTPARPGPPSHRWTTARPVCRRGAGGSGHRLPPETPPAPQHPRRRRPGEADGKYRLRKITRPDSVIMKKKGTPMTPLTLCRSSVTRAGACPGEG